MSLIAVKSGAISGIQYDKKPKEKTGDLTIHFTDGDVRTYKSVPGSVVDEFLKAQSHGYYFNAFIRDKYSLGGKSH